MAGPRFKRPESVLVVVFNDAGEVLLLKRNDHPDFWQSVTGSLEWDETPPEAARRELREETGLEANAGMVDRRRTFTFEILERWRHRFEPGVTRNREHLFSLRVAGRPEVRIDTAEHTTFAWQPRVQAARTVWSWTNREAILDVVPG